MPLIPLTTQENKRMREGEATPPRPKESIRRDLIDALRMVRGIENKLKLMLDLDT